jgi:hypothetical protein
MHLSPLIYPQIEGRGRVTLLNKVTLHPHLLFDSPNVNFNLSISNSMSHGSSSQTPPLSRHGRSTRGPVPNTPPLNGSDHGEYFSHRDSAFDGSLSKRARRAKSPHEIMRDGAISSEERSGQFGGIPIDEKEIKGLPKKVSYLNRVHTYLRKG